jgi:hypothetical protein
MYTMRTVLFAVSFTTLAVSALLPGKVLVVMPGGSMHAMGLVIIMVVAHDGVDRNPAGTCPFTGVAPDPAVQESKLVPEIN